MTDISSEAISSGGDRSQLRVPYESDGRSLDRLLDAMPWWLLIGLAGLTFLFLHQLASATEPTAPRAILIILAGAAQYLFPVLLLIEATGVAIAPRRVEWWRGAPGIAIGQDDAQAVPEAEERASDGLQETASVSQRRAERIWSLALLNRFEPRQFAALAMAYYRERGMRCDVMPSCADGAIVLKLFQEGHGKPPVAIRFMMEGAAWMEATQILALRAVMDRNGIEKGVFMTAGVFSTDAKACALANGVTLVDGKLFSMMIIRLGSEARERLLDIAAQAGEQQGQR